MGNMLKVFANFVGGVLWWIIDKAFGVQIYDWVRAMIPPALIPDDPLAVVLEYGPLAIFLIGAIWAIMQLMRERRDARNALVQEPPLVPADSDEQQPQPIVAEPVSVNRPGAPVSVYSLMAEEQDRDDSDGMAFARVAIAIRELGGRGEIVVWGKERAGELLQPIPRGYWKDHQIDLTSFMKGSDEGIATGPATYKASDDRYDHLQIQAKDIELVKSEIQNTIYSE
jgi:hypothetical protein